MKQSLYAAVLDVTNRAKTIGDNSVDLPLLTATEVPTELCGLPADFPESCSPLRFGGTANLVLVIFLGPQFCNGGKLRSLANAAYWRFKQPKAVNITLRYPLVGQRVEFLGTIDRYDGFWINRYDGFCKDLRGEKGTVSYVDNDNVWVKLDNEHPELDEWDNCIQWMTDGDCPNTPARPSHVLIDFDHDVKYID